MTKDWIRFIDSVKTPLSFFTLIALILDGILIGTAAFTNEVSILAPLGLLLLTLLIVAIITIKNPLAFYHPKEWPKKEEPLFVNLMFDLPNKEVQKLKFMECKLTIKDVKDDKSKPKVSNPILTLGGLSEDGKQVWTLKLLDDNPDFSASLEMVEDKGYLFSWDEIPGNDNGKLIEFLKQKFEIDWVKTEEIEKIDNGNTIKVTTEINHLSLNLNKEKTEIIFKIDDDRTDKFMARMENGKLNIYDKGRKWEVSPFYLYASHQINRKVVER